MISKESPSANGAASVFKVPSSLKRTTALLPLAAYAVPFTLTDVMLFR